MDQVKWIVGSASINLHTYFIEVVAVDIFYGCINIPFVVQWSPAVVIVMVGGAGSVFFGFLHSAAQGIVGEFCDGDGVLIFADGEGGVDGGQAVFVVVVVIVWRREARGTMVLGEVAGGVV